MTKNVAITGSYEELGLSLPEPSLAEDVRDWRERMGWSQSQAAKALGVSLRTMKRIEAQGYNHETLLRLAMAKLEAR
jgi:DNA-binding XRE family transcriptional regulator